MSQQQQDTALKTPVLPENDEAYQKQLFSRQQLAVGAEAQKKYGVTDVLVVGMTGLGLELVKSLVLSGVRKVTMVDDTPISWSDLSSMFYATPEDVGKPRAATLLPKICELNRFVKVTAVPASQALGQGDLVKDEILKDHHIAVFVDKRTTLLQKQNEACRKADCKMICCESRGVGCSVFVDGGEKEFTVLDKNGEDTVLCVVADISPDGTIFMSDDKKHELENGDLVYFMGLPGVHGEFLNSPNSSSSAATSASAASGGGGADQQVQQQQLKMFKVKDVVSPYTIQIELPDGWKEAEVPQLVRSSGSESVGGFLQTTKVPIQIKFKSLEESLADPMFFGVVDDDPKLFCEGSLHNIFRAIHRVANTIQSDNVTNAMADIVAAGKEIDKDIDEELLKIVAYAFHGNLNPMASFVGGVAAQEVLKLASGKYKPIEQWLYYDMRELVQLSPARTAENMAEFAPRNSRYDGQIAVIGATAQQRILDSSAFIVGAGALGCEHIKNLAMVGVGCGKGDVTITDMDNIELSNLSRQFLFRQHHVQQQKSIVAAEAAKEMNPQFNIIAKELRVGAETETIFNEKFWHHQTVILNALDNVPARLYVDEQCVINQRPLFESGTTGSKMNTQCVIPFLTENYGATRDPPEKEYALCTLKNFPNAIEHTIHWAKEAFGTEFTAIPTEVNSYIHNTTQWREAVARDPSAKAGAFKQIVDALASAPGSWADCVEFARLDFEKKFVWEIKQLMFNLPLGAEKEGKPVWGGAKRPPTEAVYDDKNPMHVDFLLAAASLRASTYGIERPTMHNESDIENNIRLPARKAVIPEWKPKTQNYSAGNEGKEGEQQKQQEQPLSAADSEQSLSEKDLPPPEKFKHLKLTVQEFEKDDDTNFHIDYMTAVSNLRASNYQIPTATRDHTKFIAGKIIPAMITTTASATGLVALEMLKYFMGANKLIQYRNSFMNVAIPLFALTPPTAAAKAKCYTTSAGQEVSFTNWDRIDIGDGSRDMKLKEVVDELKQRYDIDTDMISTSTAKLLYTGPFTKKDRLEMGVTEVLAALGFQVKDEDETVALIATGTSNDEDVDIPAIQYRFRGKALRGVTSASASSASS